MKFDELPKAYKYLLTMIAVAILLFFIGGIGKLGYDALRPRTDDTFGVDSNIIIVPKSYGAIVAIARMEGGLTIAFESGAIIIVFIGIQSGGETYQVVWQ